MLTWWAEPQVAAGMTLWDYKDLEKHVRERPQSYNNLDLVASESLEDKYSSLNVEGSVKASALLGFLKGEGSAKYMYDEKKSKHQARVTLKYDSTTKFQELSMDHLGKLNVKHPEVFDRGLATHVVTAILYGANAFFVFDRKVTENENFQQTEGKLKDLVAKMSWVAEAKGSASLKKDDKEVTNVNDFSCKFHGDFLLKKTPSSFQDAIEVYHSLPKLLGPNGEKAVPLRAWLMPLTSFDPSAASFHEISPEFVEELQAVVEDLQEVEVRCNDALSGSATQLSAVGKSLSSFKEKCSRFKADFKRNFAKKLVSVRRGEEEEKSVLTALQEERQSSPFSSKNLSEWLDRNEKEMCMLNSFIDAMRNVIIVSSQKVLYKETLSADHAVCFMYASPGSTGPDISDLSTKTPQVSHGPAAEADSVKAAADALRRKAKLFEDFAEANEGNKNIKFLMMGSTNEQQKGSSVHLYKDGFPVDESFEPPSAPEAVTVSDTDYNSVTLRISAPKLGVENITSYSVEYCISGEDEWQKKNASLTNEVTVSGLHPNTEYMFRCRAVTSVGDSVGPARDVSASIKTLPYSPARNVSVQRLAEVVKAGSTLLLHQTGPLPVYKVPLQEEEINITGCRCFSFGKKSTKHKRTIMALGATGAGKSTLINGMINHILGVQWEDKFRFKLVDEDPSKSQAESQTAEVTVYKINYQEGFRTNHSLTIIDTPGFGDVRGKDRDMEIVEQVSSLFTSGVGVDEIDAVCFVVQAPLARLTPSQKYVFDSVLSIFGKDVAENIRVLVTFADGQPPPVLEAIKASGVPCPKTTDGLPVHFQFNNSALFRGKASSGAGGGSWEDDDGGFGKMFWHMGAKSMQRFFDALSVIDTKSLTMTKEVLRERRDLEDSLENLQKQIKLALAKLEEIKETSEKLRDNEAEIKRNEGFEFEVTVTRPVKYSIAYSGFYLTNCQQCHYTCHYPCGIPNDGDKKRCSAMAPSGHCKKCPGRCHWEVHYNQKYRWEYEQVTETRTVKELKDKYLQASEAETLVQSLVEKLRAEYNQVHAETVNLVERSTQCLKRLQQISLLPDPLSTPGNIDMLIEEEKCEAKSGWKQRVQYLMTMRGKAELMDKVSRGEKLLQNPQ
ncbi:uncharacterized protein V6R79_024181 [Siganus canaliculatus]